MPEGDALHRAARRLQVLVGERLEVETPHPQAQVKRLPEKLDGRRLEAVEAVGKNLLFRFEGGLTLRSHLRMRGRWQVRPRNGGFRGQPWLVLRGAEREAVLWNGPLLELHGRGIRRLGPDILADPPDFDSMLARFRSANQGRAVGEAVLDQRLVAGIGNLWKAEALWATRVSPWRALRDISDVELLAALHEAERQMRRSLEHGKERARAAYRRVGRPCLRCGTLIRSRGQGDDNRIAYWCPECQRGDAPGEA
jgi:endonuclease-8